VGPPFSRGDLLITVQWGATAAKSISSIFSTAHGWGGRLAHRQRAVGLRVEFDHLLLHVEREVDVHRPGLPERINWKACRNAQGTCAASNTVVDHLGTVQK